MTELDCNAVARECRYERLWMRSKKLKLKKSASNQDALLSPVATRNRYTAAPTSSTDALTHKPKTKQPTQAPPARVLRSTTPRALSAFRHQQQRERIEGHTRRLRLRRNYRSFARMAQWRPEEIAVVISMPKSEEAQMLRSCYKQAKRSRSRHVRHKTSGIEAHIRVEAIAARYRCSIYCCLFV